MRRSDKYNLQDAIGVLESELQFRLQKTRHEVLDGYTKEDLKELNEIIFSLYEAIIVLKDMDGTDK